MKHKETPPHFLASLPFCFIKTDNLIMQSYAILLISLISLLSFQNATASDLDKEKRWAEQISDSLLDGEAIELHNGKHNFLAIETLADTPKELGVIIIHGIGIHPDWPAVIQPLRVELADTGWNTLSLQMPVLKNEAEGKDYEPLMADVPARIDAGIRQLNKQGAKRVAIVAHSMGARMASYYLANKKIYQEAQTQTPIAVYVSIGMGTDNEDFFGELTLPVFDVIGENDLPSVLASAPDRIQSAKANQAYKQIIVKGANHFFDEQDDNLIDVVTQAITGF